ncbi:hypothetical protein EDB86DRAFT_3074579 [Lactarius hatsudake]|nr:hypothetical protein EDB86DRAFT_3074579 [Lactarius hatsudake]
MDFNSIADAELLLQDMVDGNVHLAHEATVGAIGLLCENSRLYCAKPFLISGSCKRETAEDHAKLIQTALSAIKAVNTLSNAQLSPSSPIYPWLSACALLDLHVGDDDITCNKDWKHVVAKRPRNALLRKKGILVHETWITPALLWSHLLEAGHKPQHVHAVLNPNDKQDVLLAYTLLRDIWSLPQLTSGAPGRIKARDSLCLLGSMCYHFLMPYICVDLSIGEQLEYLSYAAHLALVLYVHEKARNDFIPTALYVDLIMMIKNVFFCVVKAKIDTPNDDFSIVLLSTDCLENLFGCLWTIIGNDANVDNYQLGSRLTGTMESANILAMHPEWDKAPQHLHLPPHLSTFLEGFSGPQLLNTPHYHPFVCDVLRAVEAIPDAMLLAPFGTLLVHGSLSGDDFEDSSHNNGLHSLVQDTVLSDHPDVPLAGGGMCELKDAATSLDWVPDQHSFSNVVAIDENMGMLNKSRVLSLLFKYSKSTSSTDWLRRVQQEACFVQSEPETPVLDDTSDELDNVLMVNNPIALLVSYEENIFLCIGEIIGIHLGSKAVDYLRLNVLLEDTVHITYQVYSLVCTSPNNDKHDDNEHKYKWKTQSLLPIKFKVPGNLIQPINPSLAMPPSHVPFYLFETPTLIAFTSSLRDRLTKPQLRSIPQIAQSNRFPYWERSGEACFVAEALYDMQESSVHECPACAPLVQLDTANGAMRALPLTHEYVHHIFDKAFWAGIPVDGQCPYCPDGSPAVWRYNMQLHFQHRHQGVDTAKHEDLWKITSTEAKAMAGIWKTRHKQPNSCKLSSYMAREDEMALDEDQDSDVIKEGLGRNEYGDEEDDGISEVAEAEGWEPASGEREDEAEGIGESALGNEKDTQASSPANMAAPPRDDPRLYSPSKLSELLTTYITPSNDSLNNSGAYAQASQGPIVASGYGPPARRDGLAFWNDAAPTPQPILISSTSPSPVAGRSPQDSVMGSPESEEPTLPAILTTQIRLATQAAIEATDPTAMATDSQQLWDNVPSLPSALPPQLEVIEVKGRTTPTANKTPHPRSRALSDASVWSHAMVESNVSDATEPSILKTTSNTNLTFKWHTLGAAIRAGLLSDPMDPNTINMSAFDPDRDEDEYLAEINQTLEAEIRQDVSSVLQGWSTYKLLHPVKLRRSHDLPTTANNLTAWPLLY